MKIAQYNTVECCAQLIEITGKADGTDLVFFAKLLLKRRKRAVFEGLTALKEIKARDPTGFLRAPAAVAHRILLI
ncbi:MAG: hypothetical protein K6U74_13685 [Firmicutes bacterium]|nr:hypothetical protein [Bacillota bacterium]